MGPVAAAERAARYRSVIRLPRELEDWEFTSVLISRPVGFLLLHALERFTFITPNRVTVAGFLSFLGAMALLHFAPQAVWGIAALLFCRLICDDFDGMLARVRGASSHFGSYLDKITDVIGFFAFFTVLGLHAADDAGAVWPLVLASAGVTALVTTGYVKWVVRGMEPPVTPAAPAEQVTSAAAGSPAPPTSSSTHHPLKVFLILLVRLFGVNECDIFLFSIVMILLGLTTPLLWVLAVSQVGLCLAMIGKRGWRAFQLDRARRS
ncbi:CDP-alcohol phosphatidyltransferase family protein [Myxococcota bacterium]|nr:CDP-alcohol phosphatidyltransferase family protein [Myxococcota bacterium]MBU1411992.1 CDP-alcohol phosphatidyltransferase family protein [Myxococcota bacterium]MBU1508860.1 CDP-alcohol phosphatidyltransferase family protein [Myxococcota bacterium]